MTQDGFVRVTKWADFQHYKDRSPPWIKLHCRLLENYEYLRLHDASKAHLTGIWMLASRLDNKIPNDPEWIAERIGAKSVINLQELETSGFIEYVGRRASAPLALGLHHARPETERETETETEGEADEAPPSASEMTYARACCVQANHSLEMRLGGAYKVLVAEVERETAEAWERDGIPLLVATETIADRIARYKPNRHNRQPMTLRYFDAAVREAGARQSVKSSAPATFDPFGIAS